MKNPLARGFRPKVAAIGLAGALGLVVASVVAGASGLGGNIQIGFNNIAGQYSTTLQNTATGGVGKRTLQLWNQATSGVSSALYAVGRSPTGVAIYSINTGGGAAARLLVSAESVAPLSTNGRGLVTNLNADMVDGKHASQFVERLYALIKGTDGSVVRGTGVTSTSYGFGSEEGSYEIVFNRNVSSCVYLATIANEVAGRPTAVSGGEIGASAMSTNVNGVAVKTRSSAGVAADRSFSLVVVC
jgi:hypothetical protein